METSYILRWTLWEDADSGALQMSVAILDASWEPHAEWTKPCGPFHSAEDVRHVLADEVRRWLAGHGLPLELPLG